MLKIATIIGARPQFIKAATVSRAISNHNKNCESGDLIEEIIIHTGQHYDENMSKIFFDELQLPHPHYNLGIGSDTHGKQTGKMLAAIEEKLIDEKPDAVITYGDTNSTLAGALAASKLHILSGHVEAGLRSFNRRMPEEINRVLTDEISSILFCPTETAVANLQKEGIVSETTLENQTFDFNRRLVLNVGDVMYDSILFNMQLAQEKSDILKKLGLFENKQGKSNYHPETNRVIDYCLATLHRPENTDNSNNLSNIIEGLQEIGSGGIKVLMPLHPRTKKCIQESGLAEKVGLPSLGNANDGLKNDPYKSIGKKGLTYLEPVSYLDMILLEKHARAILTDSGGMQKEAFLLKVPCITLRNETEWVETVNAGWNILTGPKKQKIIEAFSMISQWQGNGLPFSHSDNSAPSSHDENSMSVFGNGKAADKIVDIIAKMIINTTP